MACRVAATSGNYPACIIVPHGMDDHGTAEIGEEVIKVLDCAGIINYGWKRAKQYDYDREECNCNNLDQINNDVVRDEFGKFLLDLPAKQFSEGNGGYPYHHSSVFIIHGVSDAINQGLKSRLDVIVGYGQGNKPSHTADLNYVNEFMHIMHHRGFGVYDGKPGGNYNGRRQDNVNQLYVNFGLENYIWSMQLEFVHNLRKNASTATMTGNALAECIKKIVDVRIELAKEMNIDFPKRSQLCIAFPQI